MSECQHNNTECLDCREELESALDRTTYAWNRTKERVAELETALQLHSERAESLMKTEAKLRTKAAELETLLREASGYMSYGHWPTDFRDKVNSVLKLKIKNEN